MAYFSARFSSTHTAQRVRKTSLRPHRERTGSKSARCSRKFFIGYVPLAIASDTFPDYLALETTKFFIVSDDFAMKRNNPPSLAFPFRRNERGVKSAFVAEIKWPWCGMNDTGRGGFNLASTV
jgi:hypothetical protein